MSRYDDLLKKLTEDWINFLYELSDECDLYEVVSSEGDIDYSGWTNEHLSAYAKVPVDKSVSCSYDTEGNLEYTGKFKQIVDSLVSKWNSYPELSSVSLDEDALKEGLIYISAHVSDLSHEESAEECVEAYTPIADKDIPHQPTLQGIETLYEDYVIEYTVKYDRDTKTFTDYKEAYKFFDKQAHDSKIDECNLTVHAVGQFDQDLLTWKLFEKAPKEVAPVLEEEYPDITSYSVNYTDIETRKNKVHEERFATIKEAKELAYRLKGERNCHSLEINELVNGEFAETLKCWELQKTGIWEEFDPKTNKPLKEKKQVSSSDVTEIIEDELTKALSPYKSDIEEIKTRFFGWDRSPKSHFAFTVIWNKEKYSKNRRTSSRFEEAIRALNRTLFSLEKQYPSQIKTFRIDTQNPINQRGQNGAIWSNSYEDLAIEAIVHFESKTETQSETQTEAINQSTTESENNHKTNKVLKKSVKEGVDNEHERDRADYIKEFQNITFPKDKDTSLKNWYKAEFPTDELGDKIPTMTTFKTIFDLLQKHKDVYPHLAGDSIVRERVFDELCNILECDYDDIYYTWLETGKPISGKQHNTKTLGNAPKDQEKKMDAWHNGERKENIRACSDDKLKTFLQICKDKGYQKEVDEIEQELKNRGLDESLTEGEESSPADNLITEETSQGNTIVSPDFDIDLSELFENEYGDQYGSEDFDISTVEYDPQYNEITLKGVYHYKGKDLHFGWTIAIESLTGRGGSWFADYFDYMCEEPYECEDGTEVDLSDYDFEWVEEGDERASNSKLGTDEDEFVFYYTDDDLKTYYEYQPYYCYVFYDPDSDSITTWNEFIAWCEGGDLGDYIIDSDGDIEESLRYDGKYEYTEEEDKAKKEALAKYLNCSTDDLERNTPYDDYEDLFGINVYTMKTGEHSGEEYLVLKGDKEREQAVYDTIDSTIESCGGIKEAFTPTFVNLILDKRFNYLDWDKIYENAYEDCSDWESGTSGETFIDSLEKENLTEDELKERVLDYWIEGWGSEKEFLDYCYKYNLVNLGEITKEAINMDGYGLFLASWDGEEIELGNDFYAYRTN